MGNSCIKYNYRTSLKKRRQREIEIDRRKLIENLRLHGYDQFIYGKLDLSLIERNLRAMGDGQMADIVYSHYLFADSYYF